MGRKDKRLEAETAKKKSDKKTEDAKIALAGAKAKAVAQQAKDAIAEGQTKGQLTVVLGKLKGDKAKAAKNKAGGQGVALKAKLVEQEVRASQKEASKELTRSRAKAKLLELKARSSRSARTVTRPA